MKYFYIFVCIIGTILPLSQFVSWLDVNGFNLVLLLEQIYSDKLSLFAWLDVLISAIALIGFIIYDSIKYKIKHAWLSIVATCGVGVSLGLPLYLLFKELQKTEQS